MSQVTTNPPSPNRKERRTQAAINRKLYPKVTAETNEFGMPIIVRMISRAKTGSNRSRPLRMIWRNDK